MLDFTRPTRPRRPGLHALAARVLGAAVVLLFSLVGGLVLLGGCARHNGDSKGTTTGSVAPTKHGVHPIDDSKLETALLAGGCFWGMEEILRKIPGVVQTEVGYTGGTTKDPKYEDLHDGTTGHAEAVRIVFDRTKLSYETLLENWFFRMHDPTTKDRQGNDVGSQYRSAIFVASPEQRRSAEAVKKRVDQSGKWNAPVVTQIADAGVFTPAEESHQDYLQKQPTGYTCHYLRD